MQLRYRLTTMLAAAGLLLAATAFAAARPTPTAVPLEGVVQPVGGDLSTNVAACRLGVTGVPAWLINGWLSPPEDYYTLIRPSDCTTCNPRAIIPTIAHVVLEFRSPCPVPVEISIVGATGTAACRTPDFTATVCPPVTAVLTPPGPGIWDFPVALPAGCCITNDAFLVVRFTQPFAPNCNNLNTNAPRLVTTNGCVPCTSYNVFFGGPLGGLDVCSVGFPGNPIMNVEAECCQVVPTLPGSWGRLKIRYND